MSEQDDVLPPLPPFAPGVYRHWKTGDLYLALFVAGDSESRGNFVVNYYSYKRRRWWHRDHAMWHEGIHERQARDGSAYTGPRFVLLRPVHFWIPDVEELSPGYVHASAGFYARAMPVEVSLQSLPSNPGATIQDFRESHKAPGGPARPAST